MDNFIFKTSSIYSSLKWGNLFVFKWIKILKITFLIPFAIIFFIFLFGFFSDTIKIGSLSSLLGLALIFFSFFLGLQMKEWFLNIKLKNLKLKISLKEIAENPNNFNLAEFLSYQSADAINKSIKFSNRKKLPFINSSVRFYRISDDKSLNFVSSTILVR